MNDAVNGFAGLVSKLYGVRFETALPAEYEMWPGKVMKIVRPFHSQSHIHSFITPGNL